MKTIRYNGTEWNVSFLKSVSKTEFRKMYGKTYSNVDDIFDILKDLIKGV